MKEIRVHGRGGQGNVAAAELLGQAAFTDGKFSQSFPAFGAERAGAPVVAFVRLSSTPIRVRSQVYTPDVVIVQDETLLGAVDVLQGLKPDGLLIINSKKKAQELALATSAKVLTIPASEIALAVIGRNIPNTTLLGAYAAATGDITEYALIEAIHERFGARGREINAQAVQRAAEYVRGNGAQQVAGGVAFKQKASDRPKWVAGTTMVAGASKYTKTGSWRTFRPVFKHERCTGCQICATLCPEGVVYAIEKKQQGVDYDYCKAAVFALKNALSMTSRWYVKARR